MLVQLGNDLLQVTQFGHHRHFFALFVIIVSFIETEMKNLEIGDVP